MVRARLLRKAPAGGSGAVVLCGFAVQGHADFRKRGRDIVCAAVSALVQTTLFGLKDILGENGVEVVMESGDVRVSVSPEKAAEDGPKAILRTLELGLRAIADTYPQSVSIMTLSIEG